MITQEKDQTEDLDLITICYLGGTIGKEVFPGGSEGKASACNAGDLGFDPWVGKIPWRRKWQSTPVPLPGKSLGRRRLEGCSPWGRKELDMTKAT